MSLKSLASHLTEKPSNRSSNRITKKLMQCFSNHNSIESMRHSIRASEHQTRAVCGECTQCRINERTGWYRILEYVLHLMAGSAVRRQCSRQCTDRRSHDSLFDNRFFGIKVVICQQNLLCFDKNIAIMSALVLSETRLHLHFAVAFHLFVRCSDICL